MSRTQFGFIFLVQLMSAWVRVQILTQHELNHEYAENARFSRHSKPLILFAVLR
jgi:hypothetical protein